VNEAKYRAAEHTVSEQRIPLGCTGTEVRVQIAGSVK
jgi:hypothetical protein